MLLIPDKVDFTAVVIARHDMSYNNKSMDFQKY